MRANLCKSVISIRNIVLSAWPKREISLERRYDDAIRFTWFTFY